MLVERMTLTEKEHIKLVEVGNSFWNAFGKLVAKHVEKMPPELETKTLYYLQDKASVFGSDYERHFKRR